MVVSKAKTHMWTRMTGATKNLFGIIPGLEKPVFHSRFQDERRSGEMLVDLNECMRPRLQVVDAVMGMEGDGPQAGTPPKDRGNPGREQIRGRGHRSCAAYRDRAP